jgi:hypothetical protein
MTDMRQKKENNHHTIHSEVNNVDGEMVVCLNGGQIWNFRMLASGYQIWN